MEHFETMAHYVVRQPQAIRIHGPIGRRARSDNVNERILGGAEGKIDGVVDDWLSTRFIS